MQYQIGDSIGDYIVLGHLGTGASGEVYRVEHTITKRVEAMKILLGPMEDERARRILREAKLQARLNHPNITALHTAFWWNGGLALVMELVDGTSLRNTLDAEPLPLETAYSFARQMLMSLGHAHQNDVIHRDISPSNILVTRRGRIKLTDFGLAKDPADHKISRPGSMVGSLHYTAPEQIRSTEVDQRADLYSCGAVLFEMFTGTRPFDSEQAFELMVAHTEQPAERPSARNRRVPQPFDDVLLRALEKDPAKRFASAQEFLAALDRAQNRAVPAYWYAAASFAAISVLIGSIAWPFGMQPEPPLPPPMPSVAIRTPPFALPPLVKSEPVALDEPAPAPRPAPPLVGSAAGRITKRVLTPGQPVAIRIAPAPTPVPVEAPIEEPATLLAAPQLSVAEIEPEPPKTLAEPLRQRPGFLRGLVDRVNPFRRRPSSER